MMDESIENSRRPKVERTGRTIINKIAGEGRGAIPELVDISSYDEIVSPAEKKDGSKSDAHALIDPVDSDLNAKEDDVSGAPDTEVSMTVDPVVASEVREMDREITQRREDARTETTSESDKLVDTFDRMKDREKLKKTMRAGTGKRGK